MMIGSCEDEIANARTHVSPESYSTPSHALLVSFEDVLVAASATANIVGTKMPAQS